MWGSSQGLVTEIDLWLLYKADHRGLPMRNKSGHWGKIKDKSNNGEARKSWEGGTNAKPNRLKVSAPHFTADGDFMMHSSPLVLYLLFSHLGLARSNSLVRLSWLLSKYIRILLHKQVTHNSDCWYEFIRINILSFASMQINNSKHTV